MKFTSNVNVIISSKTRTRSNSAIATFRYFNLDVSLGNYLAHWRDNIFICTLWKRKDDW